MARYLVTGGGGFIGSNLALSLENQGHEVVAVDNFQSGDRRNLTAPTQFRGEILDLDVTQGLAPLELRAQKWDAVFHHGDITDPRYPNSAEVLERNVRGFIAVVQFSKRSSSRLVYASTAGLYGNGPVPMREDQELECVTAYGESKRQMERIAREVEGEYPVVGLRYFNVFGPREECKGRTASMVLHLYRQMKAGGRPRLFEFGEQRRDFVYVKDVVRANLLALHAPSGTYNVGSGVGESFNQVVAELNRCLGMRLEPEYFPIPFDVDTYQSATQADLSYASARLGYKPEWPLRLAIKDYVEFLQEQDSQALHSRE